MTHPTPIPGFKVELGALVLIVSPSWRKPHCSRFTTPFEEAVAFLAQRTDKTSVKDMFGIAWATVGAILERVVERLRPQDPLDGLVNIGVDELSYRKGHRYLTLVTDHDTHRIAWAMEGKTADTFNAFFDELGPERCQQLKVVTMDMSKAYISAVEKRVPQAQIVFDRFVDWISWASRSRLPAFVKVAKTIRKCLDDIVAYIRHRLTNGLIEGLNNKARLLTRRAYGFHSASSAIAMIMLCCTGLKIDPPGKSLAPAL